MSSVSSVEDKAAQSYGVEAENSAATKKAGNYGKTIGQPKLSDKAAKYYEQLKKKFSNMDFILVSADQKEAAKARAASYANPYKTVVLIDEEKLERMAEDESFRAQYEGVIKNAAVQLSQMKNSVGSNSSVKGYGIQINDNGTASFFAVVDKSLAAQRERIAKKAAEKKENARKEAKRTEKEKQAEALEERRKSGKTDEDMVMVTGSSIDDLKDKIDSILYSMRSDQVITDEERQWGQNIDFKL